MRASDQSLRPGANALHQILRQPRRRSLPELRAPMAPHPVTHGQNGFEAVVLHLASDLPAPLRSNDPEFPDSCLPGQFALVMDVHQMLIDGPNVLLKQLRHQRQGEQERFAFKLALRA